MWVTGRSPALPALGLATSCRSWVTARGSGTRGLARVPVPVPVRVYTCGNGKGLGDTDPSITASGDVAAVCETSESFPESLVADAESVTEGVAPDTGGPSAIDGFEDGRLQITRLSLGNRALLCSGDGEMHVEFGADKGERDGLGRTCRTVLSGEEELLALASEGERSVDPGEEVAGSAEALTAGGGAVLAGVMHDDDGKLVRTLELAEIAEHGGDVAGLVLVDPVEAHEGVEEEKARRVGADGLSEPPLIARQVESDGGCGDDADGQSGELEAAVVRDTGEALFDHGRRVLRHVDEDMPGLGDGEGVEAGGTAGHGDGEIEPEPALPALGRAADDADAGACPEGLHQPSTAGRGVVEIDGAAHRQHVGLHL